MLPPVNAEISSVTQKITPMACRAQASSGQTRSPFCATHIGPPCGLSGSSVLR
jgi:hypothetical protein